MKKQFFLIIVIVSSLGLKAQNLVPNGDFEDTLYCPQVLSQMQAATGWMEFSQSPDYFHSCAPASAFPSADVPFNWVGFQFARSGEDYGGFISYYDSPVNREIMGIQLTQPLVAGEKYFVTFFVCRAVQYFIGVGGSSNKLGVRFSTVSYSAANPMPIDGIAHVYTDSVVTDSVNWYKISGSFIADSNYVYLAIGNFFPDSATTFLGDSTGFRAYYYVDDVCVSVDSLICNEMITGEASHKILTMEIAPNPATTSFTIYDVPFTISNIEMYNVMGEKRLTLNPSPRGEGLRVDVSTLAPGIYFVKLVSEQGSVTRKIIVQR